MFYVDTNTDTDDKFNYGFESNKRISSLCSNKLEFSLA